MAARSIPDRRERLLTIAVLPLLNCSARLPVFALLLGLLFWGEAAWKPGLAMAGIYVFSALLGAVASRLISRWIPESQAPLFALELPMLRRPRWIVGIRMAGLKTIGYVRGAGPTIFVLSILVWAATVFPNWSAADAKERIQSSWAGQIATKLEPVFEPMGLDGRVGVSILSAFAAREVFVATLSVILGANDSEAQTAGLVQRIKDAKRPDGRPLLDLPGALALIVFFLVALQCLSTVAIVARETKSKRFATVQLIGYTLSAYVLAIATYQTLVWFRA